MQPPFGFTQMPVVEGVGVHLHEEHECMESKEDLRGPSPVTTEGNTNRNQLLLNVGIGPHSRHPKGKPKCLINALYYHPHSFPPQSQGLVPK